MDPDNPAYNVQVGVALRGRLRLDALEAALTEIVRRHETLRTTFSVTGGEPRQIISTPERLRISPLRLAGWPEDAREAEALRLADCDVLPFDYEEYASEISGSGVVCSQFSMTVG